MSQKITELMKLERRRRRLVKSCRIVFGSSAILASCLYCFIFCFLYTNDFLTWLLGVSSFAAFISALLLIVFATKSEFDDTFGSPGNNYPFY